MSLTRDQILAARDWKIEAVEVPEWGGTVHVRSMSGRDRREWEAIVTDALVAARAEGDASETGVGRRMVVQNIDLDMLRRCLCDEEGVLLFTADDVEALRERNLEVVERLIEVAARLSGVSQSGGSDVLNAAGNSSGEAETAPGSDSPQPSGAV